MKTINTKGKSQAAGQARLALSGNGTRRKRTRDRVGKREALILAALRLFASKGYEVTTTREIAASAGCAEGLIHRYFKGKAGLLLALMDYRVSKELLNFRHEPRPAPNLEDEFLQLVKQEVERVWDNRDFLRVLIPRAIVDPAARTVMNETLILVRATRISDRLKEYESCMTLPQEAIEASAQIVGMLGLIFGFVRPVLFGQDRLRATKTAISVAKIFCHGLLHSDSSAPMSSELLAMREK